LKACGRLKAESSGAANVKRQHLNLLEVYFELFLLEVESLLRRGVIKKYRKQTHNTKALKGKLEFAGHIRHNAIHKERFYTTHQVYDSNHLLHQVLYKALTIVDQFTMGTRLNDLSNRVLLNFPKVDSKTITTQQLNSITLNRKSSSYTDALELARLIILNYSPDISSGKEKMLSLLFDMNVLWEEYILKQLEKACYGSVIEVSGQESKSFWGSNSLKPDVVLRKGSQTFIIDTKWKRPNKSSASVNDLRQMYAYCRFWNAEKALLLYPGDAKGNRFKSYLTDDYGLDEEENYSQIKHQCKMGFVSVLEGGELDKNLGEKVLNLINGI
jgi:5-methylcytosine-specific restriction enzyme subunit McrC